MTKPPSTSLWFALAFLGMLSRLLSASTIADDDGTGGGEEWGVGNMTEKECLFDDDRDNDEYEDDNEMTKQRMGRCRMGEQTMGGNLTTMILMLSVGCPLGVWGRGCQLLASTPPPPWLMMTIADVAGGQHAPPCPVRPVPPDAARCC